MTLPAVLADFVDDELLRAPMTFDIVADAVYDQWRLMSAGQALSDRDPARMLRRHRGELIAAALKALRESVQADLHGRGGTTSAEPAAGSRKPGLSLIDEDDVLVDIELSRCIETIKLEAESELRELQTYTSALVGDHHVSRDTNPFRPELYVRALWAGVQELPLHRSAQTGFMHAAAQPLAKSLKMAYEAAIDRLDQRGVTPATHRTIVVLGTGFAHATSPRHRPPRDLNVVRETLPMPLAPMPPTAASRAIEAEAPPPGADPQLIGLLTRLFDEIHADHSVPAELSTLLLRLQPAALRVALRDPVMLDSYDHPVWRLLDELAHAATLASPSDRLRVIGLARNLVVHLSSGDAHDATRFEWALERVAAMNRHLLAQARQAAEPELERQRHRDAQRAATATAPLDIGTLDTVPAELLPADGALTGDAPFQARPGDHLHAYLQGERRTLQLLEVDVSPPLWLLREPATERLWALRPAALERLASEGLAKTMKVRSLVRRAADRVLRAM